MIIQDVTLYAPICSLYAPSIGTNNLYGYLMWNGIGVINGHVDTPDLWSIAMNLKKQDKTYTTADLAGRWAIAGFGDDGGNSFNAEFGLMTCNRIGTCTIELKNQRDGDLIHT